MMEIHDHGAPVSPELAPIATRIEDIYRRAVDPLGERFAYPRAPHAGEIGGPPLVLIVGNHSSGKSSFINHLLGDAVQTTGLAPTDDAFTVLAHGPVGERKEDVGDGSIPRGSGGFSSYS